MATGTKRRTLIEVRGTSGPKEVNDSRQPITSDYVPVGARAATTQATSQEQIIAAVERRYNAKVVRVTETTVAGRPALRLRLLSARRVWNVLVDAATGQELAGD